MKITVFQNNTSLMGRMTVFYVFADLFSAWLKRTQSLKSFVLRWLLPCSGERRVEKGNATFCCENGLTLVDPWEGPGNPWGPSDHTLKTADGKLFCESELHFSFFVGYCFQSSELKPSVLPAEVSPPPVHTPSHRSEA